MFGQLDARAVAAPAVAAPRIAQLLVHPVSAKNRRVSSNIRPAIAFASGRCRCNHRRRVLNRGKQMFVRRDPKRSSAPWPLGMLLIHLLGTPGLVAADEAILADGVPTDGNTLLVGDQKQWDTPVGREPVSSASGFLATEPEPEHKSLGATWNGEGEAQLFLAHAGPQDYSAALAEDAALAIILRVKQAPTKKVLIKMGCVYPCASSADITRLLEALTPEQWARISFDLKCFADGGLEVGRVDTPFLLTTRGAMSLSIADVSLISGLGPEATIRCRD